MRFKKLFKFKNKGFTLVELILAIALTATLLGLIVSIYVANTSITASEMSRSDIRQDSASAMHQITEDLRQAKEIISASSNQVTFWVDEDWDNVQDAGEISAYSWAGNGQPLTKTVSGGASGDVLYNVYNFAFSYDSGVVSSIKLVTVAFAHSSEGESITLKTSIKPRNIQ